MKPYFAALVVASVLFLMFSWHYGQQMIALSSDLWRDDRDQQSQAERDAAFDEFLRDRAALHAKVRGVSVAYYAAAAVLLAAGSLRGARGLAWRVVLRVAAGASVVMLLWSLMLSGHISFDEVYPAWLAAGVVIGALSLVGALRGAHPALLLGLGVLTALSSGCGEKNVHVRGRVLTSTGAPASGARVLVSCHTATLLAYYPSCYYGLTADSQGQVDATFEPPNRVRGWYVEMCTREGEYAVINAPPPGFVLRAGDVAPRFERMVSDAEGSAEMTYESFSGAYHSVPESEIQFVGEAWLSNVQ